MTNKICNGSTLGEYSYLGDHTHIGQNTTIGRYCSIANLCTIGAQHHDMTALSTFPHKAEDGDGRQTIIGHDVWIGSNSVVISGVTIGTGAVIGAGSVVTDDVPPYAIAYGNPARIHRYRFDRYTIDKLLQSRWWELSIAEAKALPVSDPLECIKRMGKP